MAQSSAIRTLRGSFVQLARRSLVGFQPGIGWLFAAALIPGIVAGSILFYEIYEREREQLEQAALQTARAMSNGLERELAGMRGKLEILATMPSVQGGDLQSFYRQAQDALKDEALAEAILLIDASGQQLLNTLRPFGSALPGTGHPDAVRRTFETGRPVLTDLYIGAVSNRPFVALEVPVVRDGKVLYALDMGIPSERLNGLLLAQKLPAGWIASVLDSQGTVVARNQNAATAVGRKATPDLIAQLAVSDEARFASHTLEGAPSFVAFSRSPASSWTVAVAMTRDVLYADRYGNLVLAGLTMLALALAGALLAWIFSQRIRGSLQSLEAAAHAATRGDMDALAVPSGPREIARLAEGFNEMQEARKDAGKRARESLRDSEERLSAIVNSAMDAIISIDDRQRIRLFNPAAAQMFGLDAAEAIGQPLERLIPQRFRGAHAQHVSEFAQADGVARRMGRLGEISGLRANGEEFPIEASISSTPVAGGRLLTVILRDITTRKRAEIALGQLRSEMDEMLALHVASQTAAAIAHELNQPLNAIASYSEAALRLLRAGNPKPDRLLHALESSGEQAQRAGQVMRELIEFLHRGNTTQEAVDLNDAVRRVLATVEAASFGGFEASVDLAADLKPVRANRLQVEKVLANLLRNSVEAMRGAGIGSRSIAVTIRTRAQENEALVTVRDSGPGLDPQTARRIFEPFFTTKPKGIGMGLAISRALVEAHGGRLWVAPDAGPGATFHFTLPFAE